MLFICIDQVAKGQQRLDAAAADNKRIQEEKEKYISIICLMLTIVEEKEEEAKVLKARLEGRNM